MKFFLILAILPFLAFAQNRPQMQQDLINQLQNMDPAKVQQQVEQMQKCVGQLEGKLEGLEKRGQKIHAKIESLCKAGKRDEAQAYGTKEGQRFMNDPAIKKVSRCSQQFAAQMQASIGASPYSNQHICDQ